MMWYFGLCFKPQGYYSGRMDASRKALKAGLQINNKAAMQVQAEAIVHPPVIYQSPCRWCKTSLSWQRAMLLESLWMLTLHCKDWDGYDVFFSAVFSVFFLSPIVFSVTSSCLGGWTPQDRWSVAFLRNRVLEGSCAMASPTREPWLDLYQGQRDSWFFLLYRCNCYINYHQLSSNCVQNMQWYGQFCTFIHEMVIWCVRFVDRKSPNTKTHTFDNLWRAPSDISDITCNRFNFSLCWFTSPHAHHAGRIWGSSYWFIWMPLQTMWSCARFQWRKRPRTPWSSWIPSCRPRGPS